MTYIEKIDIVLYFFAQSDYHKNDCFVGDELVEGVYTLSPEFKKEPTANNDIGRCLDQLEDDKYIKLIKVTKGEDTTKYTAALITYKGLMFLDAGGYNGEIIRKNAENTRIEKLEIS